MTSFPSNQEQDFHANPGEYRVEHETNIYHETAVPSESHINRPPQKLYSFNDNMDTQDSHRQKPQHLSSNNDYLSNIHQTSTTNYHSAAQPAAVDSQDLNSRLDKLLKSAETALTRGKVRGGSISAYHQVSSPIAEIDSALTFNTTEPQKRNHFTIQTPSAIPQRHSPTSSLPSQPLAASGLGQSISINSAELQNQTPINFTPNALSQRYSPISQYPSQPLDVQTSTNYNLTASYNLSSETQKRSGLSSIPIATSAKYSPYQTSNVDPLMNGGGSYTSRSYTLGTELDQRPPQSATTTSYETQIQNMNTLPRNYNLFPIRETERSSHISNIEPGMNDVNALKKGINNVEDLLKSLDNFGAGAGVGGITGSQDLLSKTITAQYNQNIIDYNPTEPTYRENTSYISTIYPVKTREFETLEQPKKSYAANSDYSQSYNHIPNYSNSYSPERLKSNALRESDLEQEKTQQAMKNIDQLMHRHIFHNRPLTKSTVGLNQPLRYMSPTRGSGTGGSNDFYVERQWSSTQTQPQTQTFIGEHSSYQQQFPREREVRSVSRSYKGSIHNTPTVKVTEAPKSSQLPTQYTTDVLTQLAKENKNTYISPVKDLTLPGAYGSTTNYKEYMSSPRPARTSTYTGDDYRLGMVSSPLPHDEITESYGRVTERFKGTGLTFGQGIVENSRNYGGYYNPEILNSADRKMKRLTLRARSPEERDSEKRDHFRYTPSDIREVHGAEYMFSEHDASHFDFRPSAHDLFTDPDSYRRTSPKVVPNKFKAGELIADLDDPSTQRGATQSVTKAGELQDDDHHQQPHPTYQTQSSLNVFRAGDLQHDHDNAFKAGDLQPDHDHAFKAGDLQPDHDKQNFNSGDLEDSPQKIPQSRNLADDGKAWQMVHRVDSRILDSVEQSFDFDAGNSTPQHQQHAHENLKRGHAPTSEEKRLQRSVDPNLWIVNPPKAEALNTSKSSQMLRQSVKKAHKKPIITHCFEKFEDREFGAHNNKR